MIDAIDPIPPQNIYLVDPKRQPELPFYLHQVHAGFPSPAENYIERRLNLQDLCVSHPDATFFVKVDGDSMVGAHIFPGSILVVDAHLPVVTGKVVVVWINDEFCVRYFVRKKKLIVLESGNEKYLPIYVHLDRDKLRILGRVTNVVSKPAEYVQPG